MYYTPEQIAQKIRQLEKRICCNTGGGGAGEFALVTQNSENIQFTGAGTVDDPLTAEAIIENSIQNGIISGGEVTWIEDYTYSVSPAIYYIGGVQYSSPYTELTLDPADLVNNRIDVFALTTDNTAVNITGVASTNPEQPSINTATQIITSFALVVANTTSPVGLSQEYIYRENAGVPTEWAASATGGIVVNSVTTPNAGTTSIEGTAVAAGNALTLIRTAATAIAATKNVLIFYIRSKATWNNNRILTFQFRNGVTNIGTSVDFRNSNSYGFVSSNVATYQRVVIPLSDFGLTPTDNVDRLIVTASGAGGTLGFYIDDIDTQGANLPAAPSGTTDNVGVFYVNKNYSGIGNALVTGYTLGTITSANAGYNAQMLAARMGDMNKAYPCPWSARNAAMMAMTASTITKAYIHVIGGNQWTYGSTNVVQNGDRFGNPAVNETPDVKFSGASTDISSLAKNNIFYYFEPNTTLFNIAKSIQLRIVYSVDALDTAWKSGFYGHLNLIQPYGDAQGLSQRGIEFNNARAEVVLQFNEVVGSRAWFYMFNYKSIIATFNKVNIDNSSSLLYMDQNIREGDGLPSLLNVKIKQLFRGKGFTPYPLAVTGNTGGGSMVRFGNNTTSLRIKNIDVDIDEVHLECGTSGGPITGDLIGSQTWSGSNNVKFNFHIKNLNQFRGSYVTGNINSALITLNYGNNSGFVFNNNEMYIRIDTASIEDQLIECRNTFPANASSFNNSLIIKGGTIIRKALSVSTGTFTFGGDCIIGLPFTNGAVNAANKPNVVIDIDNCVAVTGYCISDLLWVTTPTYTYHGNVTVKGNYKTLSALPPVYLRALGSSCVLKDALLISGAASSIDGGAAGKLIYTKDVIANVPHTANVTQQGVLTVDANITNYL